VPGPGGDAGLEVDTAEALGNEAGKIALEPADLPAQLPPRRGRT
jgi:hypothetical protein